MVSKKRKVGQVTFRFYEYPDKTWKIITSVGKNDLPDPEKRPRAFMKLAMMAAQLRAYATQQLKALDTLMIAREEIKIIMDANKADIDKHQTKLPFEEDTNE